MKKYLAIIAVLLFSTVSMAKTPWDIKSPKSNFKLAAWDKPLFAKKPTTPTIAFVSLDVLDQSPDDNLTISVMLNSPGIDDGHTWRVTIPTQVYAYTLIYSGRPHTGWTWITRLYTVDIYPGNINGVQNYPAYHQEKYIVGGSLGAFGLVDASQYYISSFVQL